RRIAEGAAMIRSKGEAGTGNVVEAVRHLRQIKNEIARLRGYDNHELYAAAKELRAPYELVKEVADLGRLPVVLFSAGGVATPAAGARPCAASPATPSRRPSATPTAAGRRPDARFTCDRRPGPPGRRTGAPGGPGRGRRRGQARAAPRGAGRGGRSRPARRRVH